MEGNNNNNNNSLAELLSKDKKLSDSDRHLFITYAKKFEGDLRENLELTSFELDDKYGTGFPTSWQAFLKNPIVSEFIDGFLDERANKLADKRLGSGDFKTREALKVKETIAAKNKKEDNSEIIVMFLPEKSYEA